MKLRYLLLCLASLLLVSAVPGIKTATQVLTDFGDHSQPQLAKPPGIAKESPQVVASQNPQQLANQIFQKVNPAVVTVYSGPEIGSGSIITSEGWVLTNKHVVWSSPQVKVKTADGKFYKGWVASVDLQYDLALILLDTKERFPIVPMASTVAIKPGEKVYAIGSPKGRSGTFTSGSFTKITKHGSLQTSRGLLEPGNSGGPLLNIQGEMIGINKGLLKDGSGLATSVIPSRMFIERYRQASGTKAGLGQ